MTPRHPDDLDGSTESATTHDELVPIGAPVHLEDSPAHGIRLEDLPEQVTPPMRKHSTASLRLAVGSGRDMDPIEGDRAEADAAFFDVAPDDPRAPQRRDLTERVTLLEQGAKRKRWAERIVSFLTGSALAVLVWALAKADANGDARATARALADERKWLVDTVRALERNAAKLEGQLENVLDRLRYPMQGPPVAPPPSPLVTP